MNLEQAEAIYRHPNGHSKPDLIECLGVINSQPYHHTVMEQIVIADAKNRLDTLDGVIINPKYEVLR